MKDIDFIPEWYKANQNRKRRYHRQYILLASLLAVMMGWSFFVGQYIERVRADVEDAQTVFEKGKAKVDEGIRLQSEIASLQHEIHILDATTPRTHVSAVIAELSFLIRDNIILSRLSFSDEEIELDNEQPSTPAGVVVQVGSFSRGNKTSEVSLEPKRTKVILTGIAGRPADAATLISRLEQSDYFREVLPVYTKAKKVKEFDVTEFEIRCFVADYKIQK